MNTTVCKNYALQGDDANDAASLTGDEFEDKVEKAWYSCPVARKKFKNCSSVPTASRSGISASGSLFSPARASWLTCLGEPGGQFQPFLFMAFSIPQPVIAITFDPTLAGDGRRGGAKMSNLCRNLSKPVGTGKITSPYFCQALKTKKAGAELWQCELV